MQKTYKTFVTTLAKKSGEIIKKNFTLGMQKEWKDDHSPLTVTDTEINELVLTTIQKTFPHHSIIAEEGSHIVQKSDYTWVCDPIDGTIPFSHGVPVSTFSLALTKDGEVIVGAIYDPYMDRMFYAEKGKGAYMNDEKLHVSRQTTLQRANIDLSYIKPDVFDINKLFAPSLSTKTHFFSLKSFAYANTLIAAGEFIGGIYNGHAPWDVAAAKIIVEEAGGKVTDIHGNDQRYDKKINGIIASNTHVHNQLVELVRSAFRTS